MKLMRKVINRCCKLHIMLIFKGSVTKMQKEIVKEKASELLKTI